tara:strand:- start:65 stop:226 length:162 start_codon:yes stop_codon:yes gene_type:complete
MNKKIIKRDAGNPKWIRNAEITESIRLIQNQWCRDNGYAIRGRYRQKSGRNVS